jgi:hypothetical protein
MAPLLAIFTNSGSWIVTKHAHAKSRNHLAMLWRDRQRRPGDERLPNVGDDERCGHDGPCAAKLEAVKITPGSEVHHSVPLSRQCGIADATNARPNTTTKVNSSNLLADIPIT